MATFKSEAEMAPPVVEFMQRHGWEMFEEVSFGPGYPRADLVGLSNGRVHVIEMKRSLTFSLLAQAMYWAPWAELTSIVIPIRKRRRFEKNDEGRKLAYRLASQHGIGVIVLTKSERGEVRLEMEVDPKIRRWPQRLEMGRQAPGGWSCYHMRRFLGDHNRYRGMAGQQHADFETPFKETCRRLVELVHGHPGLSMGHAIAALDHHYSNDTSARSSLSKYIGGKYLPGIVLRDGKLYSAEVAI